MQLVCGARSVRLTALNDKRWPCFVWRECTKNRTLIPSPVKTTPSTPLFPQFFTQILCVLPAAPVLL